MRGMRELVAAAMVAAALSGAGHFRAGLNAGNGGGFGALVARGVQSMAPEGGPWGDGVAQGGVVRFGW